MSIPSNIISIEVIQVQHIQHFKHLRKKTRQATDLEIERISNYLYLVDLIGSESGHRKLKIRFDTQEVLLTPISILLFQTFSQFSK